MSSELGIGIIGYGFIGKVHAYCYRNMGFFYDPAPLPTRLLSVCTSNERTAKKALTSGDFASATCDYRELIERDDIQIIHICTPNHLHKEQLLAAIATNKHIYCDKPLVATADELDEVAKALGTYRGIGQMTLQYRFYPATLRAKQMIDEGFLGRLISFRAVYLHSGSVDPQKPMGWKQQKSAGGGVINDLGSHIVDLMDHLIGSFVSACAEARVLYAQRPDADGQQVPVEAEDQCTMLLKTAGGGLGTIEVSKIATGVDDELRFEIEGTRGALRFNLKQPNILQAYDQRSPDSPLGGVRGFIQIDTVGRYDKPAKLPGPKFSIGWLRGHVHCLYNFLDGIAQQRQPQPSLAAGVRLQRILATLRRSAQAKQWVDLQGI